MLYNVTWLSVRPLRLAIHLGRTYVGEMLFNGDDDARIAKHLGSRKGSDPNILLGSDRPAALARTLLTFAIGILIVLMIWQVFAWTYNDVVGRAVLRFPAPIETFAMLGEFFFEGKTLLGHTIYEHIASSLGRWLVAFALATAVGLVLGSILGHFNSLFPIGIVPVSVYQMIPGLAWLPIALLLFGLGSNAAVFIIFVVSAMVITVNVAGGIRRVPPVVVRAAKMMGADDLTLFLKVLIPYATVDIVNGLRLGMGSAWRVLIAAEMVVGTGIGLGYAITMTKDLLNYVASFACIAIICIIGLLMDKVLFAEIEKFARHRLGMEEGY